MDKKEKRKTLIALGVSAIAITAIGGATFGATYAYFFDRAQGSVHVAAGSLKVKFERTGIKGLLPVGGELVAKTDYDAEADYLNLTDNDAAVAYGVENIMPGFDVTLRFKVTNVASVSFSYELSACDLTLDPNNDASIALKNCLAIKITPSQGTEASFLAKDIPNTKLMATKVEPGESDVFTVAMSVATTVENEIALGGLRFNLQVNAVQYHQ